MSRHASTQVSWLDTIAAYWTLVVAYLALVRTTVGRHEPADDRTPAAVLIAQPARFAWPGAEPDWAERLHIENQTPVVRDEVRA